jgi:hypothetical protein
MILARADRRVFSSAAVKVALTRCSSPAGFEDRFARRFASWREVQADEACVRRVEPSGHQAGLGQPVGGVDDGGRRGPDPAGDLARGQAVLLPQFPEHRSGGP